MRPVDPRLLHHAGAARRHIAACVVLGVVAGGLVLAQAELLATGVARVVERAAGVDEIVTILVLLGLVELARALVSGLTESASQRSAAAVKHQLRSQVVAHAAELGPALPEGGRAEVATLAGEGLDGLDAYFSRYLPQLVLAAVVPAMVIVRLLTADLTAAVTVMLTVPLIPVFMVLVGMATEAATTRRWAALSRLSHHFLDVVEGLPTLTAFGRGRAQADSVRRVTDDYRRTTMATLRLAFTSSLVLELLATLSVALVAVGVGLRLVDGSLDLRTGLLVIVLAPEAYLPIREVGVRFHAAADGIAASDRVFALLDTPLTTSGSRRAVPDLRSGGRLVVDGASIEHTGRALHAPSRASLDVGVGEVVAVVGPSGVGKSSLLAAVLGAAPLAAGRVTVSGGGDVVEVAALDRSSWHRRLAWVDQSPYMATGTVADNVRLADPSAGDDVVRAALDRAGLELMPLDRRVGEGGAGLSAGERRRVGLARAALRDAPLVLLDEPTAGLDHETEELVLAGIRRLAERSAVLMATHRPAAIAMADRVVSLASTPLDAAESREPTGAGSSAGSTS